MHGTDYDMWFKQGPGTLSASFLLLLLGGGGGGGGGVVCNETDISMCVF